MRLNFIFNFLFRLSFFLYFLRLNQDFFLFYFLLGFILLLCFWFDRFFLFCFFFRFALCFNFLFFGGRFTFINGGTFDFFSLSVLNFYFNFFAFILFQSLSIFILILDVILSLLIILPFLILFCDFLYKFRLITDLLIFSKLLDLILHFFREHVSLRRIKKFHFFSDFSSVNFWILTIDTSYES